MPHTASTGPPSSTRSQDLAAPDKFSGDRKTYRTCKAQLQTKLTGDAWKFRDDQQKMMYITSLLEDNAHRMINPYIINDRIDFNTIKELWDILECTYDDSDCQENAERELAMLKQGTREFSAHFADFQRIMAKLKWDPSAKKNALRQGMAGNLTDLLLSYNCPDDWPWYIRLLQRLDSKLRQREAEKKKETTNKPSRATPSSSPSMATPSPTAHVTSNPAYLGPAPMDLSAAEKQAERERIYQERRSGGLCTYCGTAGHFRAACPRPKRRPLAGAEATLLPMAPRVEEAPTAGKD